MGSQFEGRRLTLVRLSDGARFGGWSVKMAGDKWILQLNDALPEPDDTVRVVFYDDGQNCVTQGRVCILHGQNVVLQVTGNYNTVAANQEARFKLHGVAATMNPETSPVEVTIVDFSRSGFGFESASEVVVGKAQAFTIHLESGSLEVVGDIVHVRTTPTGKNRGGVRLKFEGRAQYAQWFSVMRNVLDPELNSGKTATG